MSKHNEVEYDENQISIFDILYPEKKSRQERKGEGEENEVTKLSTEPNECI